MEQPEGTEVNASLQALASALQALAAKLPPGWSCVMEPTGQICLLPPKAELPEVNMLLRPGSNGPVPVDWSARVRPLR